MRRCRASIFIVLVGTVACSGTSTEPSRSGTGGARGGTASNSGGTNTGGVLNYGLGGAASVNGGSSMGGILVGGASLGGASTGGAATGGAVNGGAANGGAVNGGSPSGGQVASGGASSKGGSTAGGAATGGGSGAALGGKASGGTATGGAATGGKAVGGSAIGGNATGGAATGGAATGGSGTSLPVFILGADISSVDEAIDKGARYADTDGTTKSIFDILKNHGFNFIRLRAFVNPGAQYGYAYGTGGSCIKSETYCDTAHTVAFGKLVKAAGMGLLLDLHYSDNWVDPGNQIIPEDWRNVSSITELANYVQTYTQGIVSALSTAGARPDIVQIGNETTPGMLMHIPNSSTDCWGNNVSSAPIGGSAANWSNLGTLLKAGIAGVKAVDSTIRTMIHIENTKSASGVVSWVKSARNQGVAMDIVGLSCYVAFQGQPPVWNTAFTTLANTFTDLSFVIAEYNPERTQANQIMRDLPNGRGLGTFFWEPTQGGEWGTSLFTSSGTTLRANTTDFQEFDSIAATVGLK